MCISRVLSSPCESDLDAPQYLVKQHGNPVFIRDARFIEVFGNKRVESILIPQEITDE
jgi:hypothetical protein